MDRHRLAKIESQTSTVKPINSPAQVLFASLIGTTIEFFDFYIYATAAVLVFPRLFFPASDPASATLASGYASDPARSRSPIIRSTLSRSIALIVSRRLPG